MRWLAFAILAYLAVAVQIGLGGGGVNVVLLAAAFVALNAPREQGLLGCVLLGLLQDLVTQHPVGLYALSYGLGGLMVVAAAQVVYREHPLTHFAMAMLMGLLTAAVLVLHGWIHPPGPPVMVDGQTVLGAIRLSAWELVLGAFYTALAAPVMIWPMQRLRRVFGFEAVRRRMA
jgi:rod shape-determining protein MreD